MARTGPKFCGVAVGCLVLIAGTGCGNSGSERSSPAATEVPSVEVSPLAKTATTKQPVQAESRKGSCQVEGSQATATLEDSPNTIVLTFEGERIASTDSTGFYANIYDIDGNGGQIGSKYLDGEPIAYFTAVESNDGQTNLIGKPEVSGDKIIMTFPKDQGGLGDLSIAKWSAAYTLAGKDVGMCPGDYDTQPFPD